jgi:hypothetical protein
MLPYRFKSCKLLNPSLSLHSKQRAICRSSSVSHTHLSIGNFHWLLIETFPPFSLDETSAWASLRVREGEEPNPLQHATERR